MKFLQKYNQYKLIFEGTLGSIYGVLQQDLIEYLDSIDYAGGIHSFQELNDVQKNWFLELLHNHANSIQKNIINITSNGQHQSWLYDLIKNRKISLLDSDSIFHVSRVGLMINTTLLNSYKQVFNNFIILCRSPKITSEQKNIQNYQDFDQLATFVEQHKDLLLKSMKVDFEKIHSNSIYDIYKVTINDKQDFQQLYGERGYNCGWCTINSDKDRFEYYINEPGDFYCLWTYKNSMKPFALFHFKSGQFKDVHNIPIDYNQIKDDEGVIDGMNFLLKMYSNAEHHVTLTNDLISYQKIFQDK